MPDEQQPTPATPAIPVTPAEPKTAAIKYIGDKYGPLAAGLVAIAFIFYPKAEKVLETHVEFVQKASETQKSQAETDKEKTESLVRITGAIERQAGAIDRQTELIREVKDDHKEIRSDIREILRVINGALSPKDQAAVKDGG